MLETLKALRAKTAMGFVGGSDLVKISEQLSVGGGPGTRLILDLNLNLGYTRSQLLAQSLMISTSPLLRTA